MSNPTEILTPIGRLVRGSLYEPQTTDAEGRPFVIKTGPKTGQPRVDFYFALAIAKTPGVHWNQTEWGAKIYANALQFFPGGQTNLPTFAWKIADGDSQVPNSKGIAPCSREGYAGHWILNFSGGFAPSIHNSDGTQQIVEPKAVNLGDYIQVLGYVQSNKSMQQPGIFIKHKFIALIGYGKRIIIGTDPKSAGFGGPLPPGASLTPIAQGFNPMPVTPTPGILTPGLAAGANIPLMVPGTAPQVQPYPQILQVPAAPAIPAPPKQRVMLPAANGVPYESFVQQGWTDALLIQHGMMAP